MKCKDKKNTWLLAISKICILEANDKYLKGLTPRTPRATQTASALLLYTQALLNDLKKKIDYL